MIKVSTDIPLSSIDSERELQGPIVKQWTLCLGVLPSWSLGLGKQGVYKYPSEIHVQGQGVNKILLSNSGPSF